MSRVIPDGPLRGLTHKEGAFLTEYVKDFNARRAAKASGHHADKGYQLLDKFHILAALDELIGERLTAAQVDAQWLLMEAVDNHKMARQNGQLSASNAALNLIAKHVAVDALAANKVDVDVSSSEKVAERLRRWRKRKHSVNSGQEPEPSTEGISFL